MRPSTEAARQENGNLNRGARNASGLRLQNFSMPEALTRLCLDVALVDQAQFAPSLVLLAALVGGSAHDRECNFSTVIPAILHDALGRPALNPVRLFCLLAHTCFRIPGPHALLWSQYLPGALSDCTFTDWGQNNKPWCLIHFTVHTTFSLVFPPFVTTSDSESSPGELLGLGD